MRIVAVFFFFQQKTAYEMRISDWSSDVCSSDLGQPRQTRVYPGTAADGGDAAGHRGVRGGASDPARCDRLRCGQTDRAGAPGLIWQPKIGRAHGRTPVTNAHLVCRVLLDKKYS